MKSIKGLLISTLILAIYSISYCQEATGDHEKNTAVKVYCSDDLHFLVSTWAKEYDKNGDHGMISVLHQTAPAHEDGIRIVTSQALGKDQARSSHLIKVGRDVVVPVISARNPYIEEIYSKGLTSAQIAAACVESGKCNWGTMLGGEETQPVHFFVGGDEAVSSCMAGFLELQNLPTGTVTLIPSGDLVETISNDPWAIGFCRMGILVDASAMELPEGIRFLPIDRNGNGNLDYMESIYGDLNTFSRGVWIGKYPHALVSDVYAVYDGAQGHEEEMAFLDWVLTGGQVHLAGAGFSELVSSERLSQLNKLHPAPVAPSETQAAAVTGLAWYILGGIVMITFLVILLARRRRSSETSPAMQVPVHKSFCVDCLDTPRGLLYDKSHTWVFMEKDGNVMVGIDDFMRHVTGPVTGIEMRRPGEKVSKGEVLLTIIQKGKRLSLYSPLSGVISDVNPELPAQVSLVNSSPYDKGWIYHIEPSSWTEESKMLQTVNKYANWLSAEFTRLKDFLAATLPQRDIQLSCVVLQDGGVLKDAMLEDMDPQIWEEFQSKFIDNGK